MSRRDVLKATGRVAAVTALAGVAIPKHVYAASENYDPAGPSRLRRTRIGAADNALSVTTGPTKLVAMADVFPRPAQPEPTTRSKNMHKDKVDVPQDRQFLGFDAYKKAIDCLRPGDVVILATPPAFRWVHFTYAIAKGVNVFMEKPVCVDGPSGRRMLSFGRRGGEEKPEGCRRPHVPPQRSAGTSLGSGSRTGRSAT